MKIFFNEYRESEEASAILFHQFKKAEKNLNLEEPEDSEASKILPDQFPFSLLPLELRVDGVGRYLDAREVASLSAASSAFYAETKNSAYWKNKLIAAGCNQVLLKEAIKSGVIQNYKNLYLAFAHLQREMKKNIDQQWMLCCLSGEPRAIWHAIQHRGLNAETQDIFGNNALHYAAMNGNPEAVIFLRQLGLDPNTTNDSGRDAFAWADISKQPAKAIAATRKALSDPIEELVCASEAAREVASEAETDAAQRMKKK